MGQASRAWREEKLTEQFHHWELRGRGWRIFDEPVALEPPFRPFGGYYLPPAPAVDTGRKHTWISGLLDRIRQSSDAPAALPPTPAIESEPEAHVRDPRKLVELQLSVPLTRSVPTPQVETFIRQIARGGEPLAFEVLATERETVPQFVASPRAATRVRRAVETCFPGIVCTASDGPDEAGEALVEAWQDSERRFAVVELGLGREFMLPLGNPRCDLLAALVGAMDGLGKDEFALFQLLFEPAEAPWAESMLRAVTNHDGKPFFVDRADLIRGVEQKISSPLFGVVMRLASSAAETRRTWEIVADMAAALSALTRPGANFLVPLDDEGYPRREHEEDILHRLCRRSGMLLSMEELIPLITPPTTAVSRKLRRETKRTNAAPDILLGTGVLSLGTNRHGGASHEVFLSREHRVRHMHLIGASGTGKSTMLFNLIRQDIENGEGVAVLDPHGDLVDAVLGTMPAARIADVVLLDPSDEGFPVGFNILAAHSDLERGLLASDLTSIFRRLSTSWGDQMDSVLRNAILAFLESSRGGTLADLRRFLLDAAFRKEFINTVRDPEVVFYWERAFPQLTGGKSIGPVITRLDEFLSRKPIRYMVAQDENRVDFSEILDRGRILLVRLPQGMIGGENTALLGSLVTAKLQMAAMSRQRMPTAQRRDFWCYMDEFQNFITPSMAEILAGARKYRLGLILAHQDLHQLDGDRDVASAVANCGTSVVFRVGDADARALERGFSHFEARDLMNLGLGEAVCRVERSDSDFNLAVPKPPALEEAEATRIRDGAIAASRAKYARPRSEVEAALFRKSERAAEMPKRPTATPASTPAEAKDIAPKRVPQPPSQIPVATPPVETVPETAPAQVGSEAFPTAQPLAAPTQTQSANAESGPTVHSDGVPPSAPDFGRGSLEHRTIQQQIKEAAQRLGFNAVVEEQVLSGAGHVDVSLKSDDVNVACEVSITGSAADDVANVRKCFAAGYRFVITVAPEKGRLVALAQSFAAAFAGDEAARVHLCPPRTVSALLKRILRQTKRADSEALHAGGHKIKRKYANEHPEADAQKIDFDILQTIARALRGE